MKDMERKGIVRTIDTNKLKVIGVPTQLREDSIFLDGYVLDLYGRELSPYVLPPRFYYRDSERYYKTEYFLLKKPTIIAFYGGKNVNILKRIDNDYFVNYMFFDSIKQKLYWFDEGLLDRTFDEKKLPEKFRIPYRKVCEEMEKLYPRTYILGEGVVVPEGISVYTNANMLRLEFEIRGVTINVKPSKSFFDLEEYKEKCKHSFGHAPLELQMETLKWFKNSLV